MIRRTTAACAAMAVAASGLVVATSNPASAASTYYACVKKKTGQTTMVKKNTKCKKGFKKVSWSAKGPQGGTGPTGPVGPQGPAQTVKDATGAVVGPFMGIWSGLVPGFTVLIDGGLWDYQSNGILSADSYSQILFTDPTCTAPVAYVGRSNPSATAEEVAQYIPGGPGRATYRADAPGATVRAWRISGPNVAAAIGQNLFALADSGGCQVEQTVSPWDVANGATLVGMVEVTPPANRPGPLTLG